MQDSKELLVQQVHKAPPAQVVLQAPQVSPEPLALREQQERAGHQAQVVSQVVKALPEPLVPQGLLALKVPLAQQELPQQSLAPSEQLVLKAHKVSRVNQALHPPKEPQELQELQVKLVLPALRVSKENLDRQAHRGLREPPVRQELLVSKEQLVQVVPQEQLAHKVQLVLPVPKAQAEQQDLRERPEHKVLPERVEHQEQTVHQEHLVQLAQLAQQEPQAKAYRLEGQQDKSWRKLAARIMRRSG